METSGAPVPLLEDVAANEPAGGGQFDFSETGTFVYAAGRSTAQGWQVASMDSSGKMQLLLTTPGAYTVPRLSPDGRKLVFVGQGADVHVHDLGRDATTRITFTGISNLPVWAPDSKHLVFGSFGGSSGGSLLWVRSDGSGTPQKILESSNVVVPWDLSHDGRRLAYREQNPGSGSDLWTLPLDISDPDHPKPGTPERFLHTTADARAPRFSPDDRWIAYRSNESGTQEIYVRPFPDASGGRWQISNGGGLYAFWSSTARQLFYETGDNRIMVLDYTVDGASFVPGKPRLWSDRQLPFPGTTNLDLAPDGRHFAVLTLPDAAHADQGAVVFLLNFFDELKRKIP